MLTTKIIGNKIAEARKKINISQAQLAQLLFISSQAVGKWERGESMPDIITFNRLAEILEVDLNYFSDAAEPSVKITAPVETLANQSAKTKGELKKKPSWDMSRGNWVDADFSGLKNLHEKFSSSNMQRCRFVGSDLSGLLLKGNNIDGCDFSGSDLSASHIQSSNFAKNIFKECSLKQTEFSSCNINGCDFSGADFARTEFSKSFVNRCDFTGADFSGVVVKSGGFEKNAIVNAVWNSISFIDTYIADVVFDGTIEDCSFENCAFKKVTFQNATITNCFFKNKSLKRIKFVDCKADRMTYEFLKNGKADLTGINLLTQ